MNVLEEIHEWIYTHPLVRVRVAENKREIETEQGQQLIGLDVQNFFVNPECVELQNAVAQFKGIKNELDRVKAIFHWVVKTIKYEQDVVENWQLPFETLFLARGDCEDGAILLANLLLAADVPYYKVMVHVVEIPAFGKYHVAASYGWLLLDWLDPSELLKPLPSEWIVRYSFNSKHAYVKQEDVSKWSAK